METMTMEYLKHGQYTYELVDYVPKGYEIWNIGHHMKDGYLPIVESGGYDGCQVILETMKAIKLDGAQTVLKAVGRGQTTKEKMEKYVKRYANSTSKSTRIHLARLQAALKELESIEFEK